MGAQRATPKARRLLLPHFGGTSPSPRPQAPEPRLQEARPAGRRPREPRAPSPMSPDLLGHMLSSDSGCHTGRSRRDGAAGPRGLGGPRRQGVLPALCPGPAQGPERPALRVLSFWAHPCQAGLWCGRPGGGQQRPPGPAVQPALPGTVWKRGHAPTCRARGSGSGTAPRQSHGPRLALSSRPGSQPSLPDPPPGDSPPQRRQALGGEGCTGLSHGPWTSCVPVEVRPSDLEDFVPRTSLRGLRVEMTTLRIVGSEHTVGLNVPCSILRLLVQTLANLELHPWLSACHCWVALT